MKLVYIETFIETRSRWNAITAWTTPSHVDEAKPDFDAIVKSFHETAAK